MPSALHPIPPHNRKRKLVDWEPVADPVPQPASKRQKQQRTSASFWDNLSRQWLTRRALEELDRRTSELPLTGSTCRPRSHKAINRKFKLADLQRFARQGGPDLRDLRGFPRPALLRSSPPIMKPSQSGSAKRNKTGGESHATSSDKKSSAYDPNFMQNLKDNGVIKHNHGDKPGNWTEIRTRLAQRRGSLSSIRCSDVDFEKFQEANENASNEDTVMINAFPTIAGTATILHKCNLLFNNLLDFPGGETKVAKPDWYDGSEPSELRKEIRQKLSLYIQPATNDSLPMLPNFFTEGKGPDGSLRVVELQAMQDATLGARGILAIRGYIDPSTKYDNNAYTMAATYHPSGLLTIYTMHVVQVTGKAYRDEYRMIQLSSFAMTGAPETFRQGATFLRNARDLMEEYRNQHIALANITSNNFQASSFVKQHKQFQPNKKLLILANVKFLIISAIVGIIATGMPSANGAAIPEEAVADIDVKRSPEAQYKPCWIASEGQVHCPLSKREPDNVELSADAQYKPCWIAADGQVHCPLSKRDSTKQLQVDPKYTTLDIPKQRECHKEKVPQAEGKFCQFPPCFDEVTVCNPPKMMEVRDAMPDGVDEVITAEN
ncbi:MAG: hypothetical protein Q9177_002992 [Variospora cf. flavescens]